MSISGWQSYDTSYNTVTNKEDTIIIEDYIDNCNYMKRILRLSIIMYVCIYIYTNGVHTFISLDILSTDIVSKL